MLTVYADYFTYRPEFNALTLRASARIVWFFKNCDLLLTKPTLYLFHDAVLLIVWSSMMAAWRRSMAASKSWV